MSLINCPECNKEISNLAIKCPGCGYYNNRISIVTMVLGLISSIILFFTGLGMTQLKSQSGNSVAEIYYHHIGYCMIGFSLIILMITGYFKNKIYSIDNIGSKRLKIKDNSKEGYDISYISNNEEITTDNINERETEIIDNKMVCPTCRTRNNIRRKYCYMCGKKLV